MTAISEHARIERLVATIRPGGRLRRAWPLEGGVSAQVTAIEVAHPDSGTERLVVRRHGSADRTGNPNIARDEFALLEILARAGVPAPRPCFLDQSGEMLGSPCIVVGYIDGSTDAAPADERNVAAQMAMYLVRLREIDWTAHDLSFLPNLTERVDRTLRDAAAVTDAMSPLEACIHEALAVAWPRTRMNGSVLLHGDFWPGNVLWQEGHIVAAIDWEDALTGDPLFDVASARLELYWLFGENAMASFTAAYASMADIDLTHLPFWEIFTALDPIRNLSTWGHDPDTEARMRLQLDRFVERALRELAAAQG